MPVLAAMPLTVTTGRRVMLTGIDGTLPCVGYLPAARAPRALPT